MASNEDSTTSQAYIDPMEAAMPHGASLPEQELSQEDRSKLANAKGKETVLLKSEELLDKIHGNSDRLQIYCFWNLQTLSCETTMKNLQKLQDELEGAFDLYYVNLDKKSSIYQVNVFIRENNIVNPSFLMDAKKEGLWMSNISKAWNKEVPAILLIDKRNGTNAFYQRSFSFDEMNALIQPYAM